MPADLGDSYREHVVPVWRYVRVRLASDDDADDVTSDVFIRALRSWHTYDPPNYGHPYYKSYGSASCS